MITSETIFKMINSLHKESKQAIDDKDTQAALICCAKVDVLIKLLQNEKL